MSDIEERIAAAASDVANHIRVHCSLTLPQEHINAIRYYLKSAIAHVREKPILMVNVVDDPTLIRVMALNKKIADQLPWLDGEGMYTQQRFDIARIDDVEFIGALSGIPVVQTADKKIWKLRPMSVLDWVVSKGRTIADGQKLINDLPQLFEV